LVGRPVSGDSCEPVDLLPASKKSVDLTAKQGKTLGGKLLHSEDGSTRGQGNPPAVFPGRKPRENVFLPFLPSGPLSPASLVDRDSTAQPGRGLG